MRLPSTFILLSSFLTDDLPLLSSEWVYANESAESLLKLSTSIHMSALIATHAVPLLQKASYPVPAAYPER
jgi:hypothetical protein